MVGLHAGNFMCPAGFDHSSLVTKIATSNPDIQKISKNLPFPQPG